MSYLYSKRGSNFGLGAIRGELTTLRSVIPEPLPEPVFEPLQIPPTRESYDPSTSYVQDPSPAEPALEISQSVPMAVEQYAYSLNRIVAGPTPTMEMPLSVADTPTALAARSLEAASSELQLRTAQESLQQALQPMQSVDTRYADPSLFTDVPIRPTLTQAEMPVALPTQPTREMITSNYETAPVRSTSLTPAAYEVMPEPTVSSAMQSRGGTVLTESPETLLSRLDAATTSTPVNQRGESLFDDPHPNLLEDVVTQQPVPGSKYDPLFTPRTETVPTESGGAPQQGAPQGSCPPGWIENAPGSCSAPAGSGQPQTSPPPALPPANVRTAAALKAMAKELCVKMASMCPNISPALLDEAVVVVGAVVDKYFPNGIQNGNEALSKFPAEIKSRVNGLIGKWAVAKECDEIAALLAETVAFLKNPAGESAGGGSGGGGAALPLIAGAAALALLFFRR